MGVAFRKRSGPSGWTVASVVIALLVVVPVAMLASSVLRPSGEVWAQQWRTRLPGEIVTTVAGNGAPGHVDGQPAFRAEHLKLGLRVRI